MRLNKRNGEGSGVYGVHHDGLDFHIVKDSKGRGWKIIVRELVETAGIKHSLGQPDLFVAHEQSLSEIRAGLDRWDEIEWAPSWWKWAKVMELVRGY